MNLSPILLPAVGLIALVALMLLVRARSRIREQDRRLQELQRVEAKAADLERQHHSLGQLMSDYLAFMRDLHGADPANVGRTILAEVDRFLGDERNNDDLSLVAVVKR